MTLVAQRFVFDFDAPPNVPPDDLVLLVGGKGANLCLMANELGLPVPPGFTITTGACRAYLSGSWPAGLEAELEEHVSRLGERVGRGFGDAANPLLVSVRSGAPVSMPGMMDTILNLGLNESTAAGLAAATRSDEFAADCLRRFHEGFAAVVGGSDVPEDPWAQLRAAIEAVFSSWNSDRARAFRRVEGIPDSLGTAVTVQAMVFGNRGPDSGTGVLFTRNPSTGEPVLYGDVMFNAQGEDVVAGTHAPEPIAVLDSRLPDVAAELRRYAGVLEHHLRDVADIEFTIQDGHLWLLQVRVGKRSPRAALRTAIDMATDPSFPLSREEAVRRVLSQLADPPWVFMRAPDAPAPIAVGLPASPGVASGEIVTSSDAAETAAASGTAVILVRPETSPEDVRGMARAAGVLTARGGLASHAAVVARGWGIPAVVGAEQVLVGDGFVDIGHQRLDVGERIAIDGSTGEVFVGHLPGAWELAPEAATLLDWARELEIEIRAADRAHSTGPAATAAPTRDAPALTPADVMLALAIKGSVTPEQLAESLDATPGAIEPLVAQLVGEAVAEKAQGSYRLSATGKLRATEAFAADRASVGDERSGTLLEEFHAFDGRMKSIVTAWQVREVGGEQTFNDHKDAEYDAGVLDDLASLHGDTAAWLEPLAGKLPRFAVYRTRLGRSLDLAAAGDQRFVASPRVDSYHSAWFELHEDLIRIAGKKRSEVAAD